MRMIRKCLLGLTVLFVLISCGKQEFDYPVVYTGEITNITDSSAVFSAKISNDGNYPIVESGFIWGMHSNDKYGIKLKNDEFTNKYALKTNKKLLPGKIYYVRAYVQTEDTTYYGQEVNFKSLPAEVDKGSWSLVYEDKSEGGFIEIITTSFTIGEKTYFGIEDGGYLYSYDPTMNVFKYELKNQILSNASPSVLYQGKAYFFSNNAMYLFDPQTKSISKLSVLNEDKIRYSPSCFIIDANIYVGLGAWSNSVYYKDFWKYTISTNQWTPIASFPGQYRRNAYAFSMNGVGYVGGGYNVIQSLSPSSLFSDLWCYLPESDEWIQKESLSFKNEDIGDMQVSNTQNYAYCFYKKYLYEYDPTFNVWQSMTNLNTSINVPHPHSFVSGNKFYILVAHEYLDDKYFKLWVYEK